VTYKAALVGGLIFAVVVRFLGHSLSNELFVYLALPGLMAAEHSPAFLPGAAFEIAGNAVFYSVLLWAVSRLFRRGRQGNY
jgi:hypothetical protein